MQYSHKPRGAYVAERMWMARKRGARVVIGAAIGVSLVVGVVLAATSGSGAREMRFACARDDSGLMRYVASPSDCHTATERAIAIAALAKEGKEVQACVSVSFGLAKARDRKGHRIVIPRGTVWRVAKRETCSSLKQRAISISGHSKLYFCAIKSDGLLRNVPSPASCKKREIALFVPKGKEKIPGANPQSVTTNEGTSVAITLSGSSHPPGKSVSFKVASAPTHGTLSGSPPLLTYTPAAGFFGSDSFTFIVARGKRKSAPATVTIKVLQVDQAPTIALPPAQSVNENVKLTVSRATSNAVAVSDVDSEGGVEQVKLSVGHGTLKLGSMAAVESVTGNETASVTVKGTIAALNGVLEGLSYTPAASFHGSDSLSVEVNDLGHTGLGGPKTASATLAITVRQVDQPPTNTVPAAQETNEGAGLTFSAANHNAMSVGDVDSEGGVEQVKLSVGHGTLKLGSMAAVESVTGNETASVTVKGTIAALNGVLEGLSYSPGKGYFGSDTLTLETDDLGHTGLEGPKTTTSTVVSQDRPG